MVHLPADALARYRRFTLYNSPYAAHGQGRAIDLYPAPDAVGERAVEDRDTGEGSRDDDRVTVAPSPVSGEVIDTRTVAAPSKPYAPEHDHLILIECDADAPGDAAGLVARVLHVDPAVAAGDRVAVGDDLGRLVRAGFFAPWVGNHLHLGFRGPDDDPYRASGSLPLTVGVAPLAVEWDGTGTVVETGDTYAVLDAPTHPAPGDRFAGVAADGGGVLDGGLRHYDGGGLLGGADPGRTVSLLGRRLGTVADDGRTVAWDDLAVLANGDRITGLSLFLARDAAFGAKLICPDRPFAVGDRVAVGIEPTGDPTVLS